MLGDGVGDTLNGGVGNAGGLGVVGDGHRLDPVGGEDHLHLHGPVHALGLGSVGARLKKTGLLGVGFGGAGAEAHGQSQHPRKDFFLHFLLLSRYSR